MKMKVESQWRLSVILLMMKSYATCLKGPTSVKDHDALAVALENQHKTLKKVSESYDSQPEKFSISCDPGERIRLYH
jgi:hypothetical protein